MLGAYVRLSDAGLGCPDWPGCYGKLIGVPGTASEIATASADYPDSQVVVNKAWKEVSHRYLAGFLGLLIFVLAFVLRRTSHASLGLILCGVVIFQAILGMWTVTLLLRPLIVVFHLLGGLIVVSMLAYLLSRLISARLANGYRNTGYQQTRAMPASVFYLGVIAAVVVFVQIALGGWVSSNYAALACPDFPTCQGQWWPANMDFVAALPFWGESGVNYEFGQLDNAARVAIHVMHRIGAIVAAIFVIVFALSLIRSKRHIAAVVVLALLATQIALGISNVMLSLPIAVAVAHNAIAVMLFSVLVVSATGARRKLS